MPDRGRHAPQPLGLQADGDDQQNQRQADESRTDELGPQYFSTAACLSRSRLRAPSGVLHDPREVRRAALQIGHPHRHTAQVLVDPASVGPQAHQLPVVLRRLLRREIQSFPCRSPEPAQAGPVGRPSRPAEPGPGSADRSARRSPVQCGDRGADRIPVTGQPGHQFLQSVHGGGELVTVGVDGGQH